MFLPDAVGLSTGMPLITLNFLVTCFAPVVFKESIGLSIPWLKAPLSCPQKLTFALWGFITSMKPSRLKERKPEAGCACPVRVGGSRANE